MQGRLAMFLSLFLGALFIGCEPTTDDGLATSHGTRLVALAQPPPPPPVLEKDADDPLPISSRDDIDERLFLVRALETLYERWPIPGGDWVELQRAFEELREEAHRHAEYIRQRQLGPELASCFDDLAQMIDRYEAAATRIARIVREGKATVEKDRADDLASASFDGGFKAGGALAAGASGGQAVAIWALLTSLGFFEENSGKEERVSEAVREAVEGIVREYETELGRSIARAQTLAITLGERYGWRSGEWGFDTSPEQARHVAEVIERQDLKELARLLEIARNRRPRDPFVQASSTFCSLIMRDETTVTVDELLGAANHCLAASEMVPQGSFYDSYRRDILGVAGLIANGSVEKEAANRGWIGGPFRSAARAVRIWRTYLSLDPVDPTGEGREQLAWALAGSGRFEDALVALSQISKSNQSDPDFAYGLACILSIVGRTDEALRWLELSVKQGFSDIAHVRSDPDLAGVRNQVGARFNDLTAVKYDWSIDWGLFTDDIVLTNRSAFALTNIAATAQVSSGGYADWNEILRMPRLAPGQTYRWSTRISSRGENTKALMRLSADQNR